jgi:hypothetical protein
MKSKQEKLQIKNVKRDTSKLNVIKSYMEYKKNGGETNYKSHCRKQLKIFGSDSTNIQYMECLFFVWHSQS